MSKISWKGGPMTSPVPAVMVTCGDEEKTNIITIAWTGTCCSKPPMTYISVKPERYSYNILKERMEFCINFASTDMVKAVDYCGIYTGAKVDKFAKCGLTKGKPSVISTPLIEECPLVLECKVRQIIPLGSHDMFIAEIVAVDLEERLLDESGKLHIEKADLIAFSHGDYCRIGRRLEGFGCSSVKKKKT